MNAYDSERMAAIMAGDGYSLAAGPHDADLVLLNTCHIREKAAERMFSAVGLLREIKEDAARSGRDVLIGVAGCVAQAEGAEIVARSPAVDLVVGPQSYHRLPDLVRRAASGERVVETEFDVGGKFASLDRVPAQTTHRVTAFLTVQEGCDKFCTFCVVPYTRGAETSRPMAAIVAEAERLAATGVRELTLLGQNVNAWHGSGDGRAFGLAALLARLAEIPGIVRLRYTTSHPLDMDEALIAAHGELPALMPYLHLPVQSGSDRILAAMNRRHTRSDYLALVRRIRNAQPHMALSSDFIVGFPGESEEDFRGTLSLVEEVGFASAFAFKYSPRAGTPAADRQDQVAEGDKADRLARLQTVLARQQEVFNRSLVGQTVRVLVEKIGRRAGQVGGRSPWLQPVHFDGSQAAIGSLVDVRIEAATANSLAGKWVGAAAWADRLQGTAA